jgi:GTP-binding protein
MKRDNNNAFPVILADPKQLPHLFKDSFLKGNGSPRILLIGRSNVGKSSLINVILKKKMAQTSNQPGKTQALYFYFWEEARKILVDFPGYGYARKAKSERNHWRKLIDAYLEVETHWERAVLVLDARHGPTQSDLQAMEFLSLQSNPVTLVFSKVDTLKSQSQKAARLKEVGDWLAPWKGGSDGVFWVSSNTSVGLKALSRELSRELTRGGAVCHSH